MAKIYQVNSPEQAVLIDKIKNSGCEVIQVSNGLLVKTSKSLSELQSILEGAIIKELDPNDLNLSKDAKVLAGITQSS